MELTLPLPTECPARLALPMTLSSNRIRQVVIGVRPRSLPFENCRASTSIFVLPSYKEPTVDALAPRTDEGRE